MQANIKQKAQQYYQSGQLKKARELYEKYSKHNPRDPEALYMLGTIHGQSGDYEKASSYFNRTLKLHPNAFVALCGLGMAEKRLGKLEEAARIFQKALKMQPDNTDITLELVEIMLYQSRFDEAKAMLHGIIEKKPGTSGAYHGLGEVHHAERDIDSAIRYYRLALEHDPDRVATHHRLGFALYTRGQFQEAIEHVNTAIRLQPNFIEAYKNLAQCHLLVGQFEQAMEALDKVLKQSPNDVDAIVSLASVFEKQGKPEDAYSTLEPLINKAVLHPGIGQVFAAIGKKIGRSDEAISYIEGVLEQKLPTKAEESLHYELGMLLDRLSRYDSAFEQFRAANVLRPDLFRPAEYTANMDAIRRTFDWTFMQSAPRASYQTEKPIFIVGMPRSGTSLTEQILDSHREVTGAGELMEIEKYAMEICTRLDPARGFPLALCNINTELLDVYAKRFEEVLESCNNCSRFVTDKMPQNYVHLGLISLMFPKTRIVHCTRNPLDTCLSVYFQSFNESHDYSCDLKYIGYYYLEYMRLMDHWKSVLPVPIHEVKYEQLVTDPEPTVRELVNFLGLEWDPACLSFYESKRHVATASYDQVRKQIYTGSMRRWKNYERHLQELIDVLSPHIPDLLA